MNYLKKEQLNKQINILFKRWLFLIDEKENQVKKKFVFILDNNKIKISEIKTNKHYIYLYEEYFTPNKIELIRLIKKLNKYFEILENNKKNLIVYFDNRVFKINFSKNSKGTYNKKILRYLIFFYKIKYIYHNNSFLNYIRNFINKTFNTSKNKLFYSDFLNLNLYPNEIDRLVRSKNLKIITNDYKNLKIKEIFEFFKKKKNKDKVDNKIKFNKKLFYESFNSIIPISFNIKYWSSSNYFLYKNIHHGFLKKNISYEKQNKTSNFSFLLKKNLKKIKNKNMIEKIINNNPIVIINKRIYSGRNRILSLLGHIINGGKFIEFEYFSYFNDDTKIRRLINVITEYYKFYELNDLVLQDHYNSCIEVFNSKGINYKIIDEKNFQKKIIISKNNFFELFEVKNFFDLFHSTLRIIFKKNISCFYYDNQNKINVFQKKKFFRDFFKISLTIFRPKLIYVSNNKKKYVFN